MKRENVSETESLSVCLSICLRTFVYFRTHVSNSFCLLLTDTNCLNERKIRRYTVTVNQPVLTVLVTLAAVLRLMASQLPGTD